MWHIWQVLRRCWLAARLPTTLGSERGSNVSPARILSPAPWEHRHHTEPLPGEIQLDGMSRDSKYDCLLVAPLKDTRSAARAGSCWWSFSTLRLSVPSQTTLFHLTRGPPTNECNGNPGLEERESMGGLTMSQGKVGQQQKSEGQKESFSSYLLLSFPCLGHSGSLQSDLV